MRDIFIDDDFALGGFTSGDSGIWTRESADMPPTDDYTELSRSLGVPFEHMVRPYQAGGTTVAEVSFRHGGSGIIKDNELKKTDGLVTAQRGLMLTVIAADCVPVYLADAEAAVIGLLHCGRQAAAGELLGSGISLMEKLGASAERLSMTIGHHICGSCYEVGEEVTGEFTGSFTEAELGNIFRRKDGKLYLDLAAALTYKAESYGIASDRIFRTSVCTCHGRGFYSYRRGDRGRQDLAFFMMK